MSYELTLVLDDDEMADRLEAEFGREYSAAAVAAEGAGIIRDYGVVLSFTHTGFPHEAASLRASWPVGAVTTDLLAPR